jgi:calcium/calmodulin-dependent protein kinase (CaM kinase) II
MSQITLEEEVLAVNQRLLDAIAEGDWTTYAELCDASLTAFEPEALGHLVHGLEFHQFYFKLASGSTKPVNTMVDPHVRVMGDVAVLCYFRLVQAVDGSGGAISRGIEETRVWERQSTGWRHVHFHRSPAMKS